MRSRPPAPLHEQLLPLERNWESGAANDTASGSFWWEERWLRDREIMSLYHTIVPNGGHLYWKPRGFGVSVQHIALQRVNVYYIFSRKRPAIWRR